MGKKATHRLAYLAGGLAVIFIFVLLLYMKTYISYVDVTKIKLEEFERMTEQEQSVWDVLLINGKLQPAEQVMLNDGIAFLSREQDAEGNYTGFTRITVMDVDENETLLCRLPDGEGDYNNLMTDKQKLYWLREKTSERMANCCLDLMQYDCDTEMVSVIKTWEGTASFIEEFGAWRDKVYYFLGDVGEGYDFVSWDSETGRETVLCQKVWDGQQVQIHDGLIGLQTKNQLVQFDIGEKRAKHRFLIGMENEIKVFVTNERYAVWSWKIGKTSTEKDTADVEQIGVYDFETGETYGIGVSGGLAVSTEKIFWLEGERLICGMESDGCYVFDLKEKTYRPANIYKKKF